VVSVPVGEEPAAQALLGEMQARGVVLELQHEQNPLSLRRTASANASASAALGGGDGAAAAAAGAWGGEGEGGLMVDGQLAAAAAVGCSGAEQRDPLRLFEDYMAQLAVPGSGGGSVSGSGEELSAASEGAGAGGDVPVSASARIHAAALAEGRATLERLMDSDEALGGGDAFLTAAAATTGTGTGTGTARGAAGGAITGGGAKELQLQQVSLTNFGPYGGGRPVVYPLDARGLVLIRGRSTDGTGADSNGAGKVCVISPRCVSNVRMFVPLNLFLFLCYILLCADHVGDEHHVGPHWLAGRPVGRRQQVCRRGLRRAALLYLGRRLRRCRKAHRSGSHREREHQRPALHDKAPAQQQEGRAALLCGRARPHHAGGERHAGHHRPGAGH
jgi:hypothetical protein